MDMDTDTQPRELTVEENQQEHYCKGHPKIDLNKALKLKMKGNTYSEIARIFDCTPQAVCDRLKPFAKFLDNPDVAEVYEQNKATLLSMAEQQLLLSMLDESAIEKASLNNRAYAFQQVANQNRLSRGQATQNIDLHELHGDLKDLQAQRDQMKAEQEQLLKMLEDEE